MKKTNEKTLDRRILPKNNKAKMKKRNVKKNLADSLSSSGSGSSKVVRKSCHQCKSVKNIPSVRCNNRLPKGRQCSLIYCQRCLLKKYLENMSRLDTWSCPRCRGICECKECLRRGGRKPVGHAVGEQRTTETAKLEMGVALLLGFNAINPGTETLRTEPLDGKLEELAELAILLGL